MKQLVVVLLLVASSLCQSGCQAMARGVAQLYGVSDPFPGPCARESLQAGRCVPVTQGEKK